jgi:hypothetical protein
MGEKKTEYCGRCSMSSVVDVANYERDEDEQAARDPFAGDRIEVDESQLRAVSPSAWLEGVKRRIDDVAARLTYGR